MKSRLALVACLGPADGPWVRSRGNEKGVRVQGLAEGERIISHIEVDGVIQPHVLLDRDGTWPLPDVWTRIMFIKQCPGECGQGSTKVELLVA